MATDQPLDLDRLEALAAAASPGPWVSSNDAVPYKPKQRNCFVDRGASINTGDGGEVVVGGLQDEQGGAVGVLCNEDAAFIAAARDALLRLVARVRELQARVDANADRLTALLAERDRAMAEMESQAELMDGLKQENRRLRAIAENCRTVAAVWREEAELAQAEAATESLHCSLGLEGRADGLRRAADVLTATVEAILGHPGTNKGVSNE